ncbi:distal tail protein Dit [Priestia aryabhattai]|uniref:distal tail protein Dit n=1 Tax=Priestia aryabhattai TaxID=412384 RepID=UPI003D2C0516
MIKFAGINIPSYVRVNAIKYSVLPSIDSKTEKVYGRYGEYDFGTEVGTSTIKLDIQIVGIDDHDVIKKARDLAQWLYYEDLQPLILDDEPDKQYMARLVGDTDIEETFRIGSGTLEFLVPSGVAEALTDTTFSTSPSTTDPFTVTNNGGIDAYPIVDLTMKKDSTSIALVSEDKYVLLGQTGDVERTSVAVDPIVLSDTFSTYSGYATASNVDGGVVTGSFASTGARLTQSGNDFGEGTTWKGASAIKSLSRSINDFEVTTLVGFDSDKAEQIGRIECYLLDSNNTQLGKIAIKDVASEGEYPMVEARAGNYAGGKYFVQSYGDKKGVFAGFVGMLRISRKGKRWSAYFAKVDAKGNHTTRLYKEWYDSTSQFTGSLSKVQIHIGAFNDRTPVKTMYLEDLKVRELTSDSVDSSTQIPIIFKTGDVVTIDNEKAIVLKNGEPVFYYLDPSSDFISLKKGDNGLIISPAVADVSIRFRERWL